MSDQRSEISSLREEKQSVPEVITVTLERGDHVENLEEAPQTQSVVTQSELEATPDNKAEEENCLAQVPEDHCETLRSTVEESSVTSEAQVDLRHPEDVLGQTETTFSADVGNSTATVKMLLPGGHMMTVAFAIGLTARELKNHFADKLKIPPDIMEVSLDGNAVTDSDTLISLGVQPHGTVQLEMSSTDPENHPIRPVKLQTEYNMPDVITVRVQTDGDTYQDVVVEIERATQKKAFLGGYRHKITGTEFHHSAVQTLPKRPADKGVEVFRRDTQTVETKSQAQQCTSTTATQMTSIGCYVSNMEDKLISPGQYVTADECLAKKLKAVVVLQVYARRWQAKRRMNELRREKQRRLEWLEKEEARKRREKEEQKQADFQRRMNPETKEDFSLLYNALEKWRREEADRINATLSGAERKCALYTLLNEEAQHIASIGQHRFVAAERSQEKAVQTLLDKCAAPKKWRASDGKMIEMDTVSTIRAKDLRDLYASVNMPGQSQDERQGVLLALKTTVKEHDCKLTREILELIDREVDLLARGVKKTNLEGLRKRLSTLFLQYIKTPAFNPEVSSLLKVPPDAAQQRKKVYRCKSCNKYLPCTGFSLSVSASQVACCRQCLQLDNEARRREDLSLYRNILQRLRNTEAELHPEAKITYLLQEQDLRYLVDMVWGAQSALSAWDDLQDLEMARWDRLQEWSPWNCILLTRDEAKAHLKVENIQQAYGSTFIRRIQHKHMLAQSNFSQIPDMAALFNDMDSEPTAHSSLLVAEHYATATETEPQTTPIQE
ncbi:hypothetical protein MATL_G00247600 [Megalops atlanticus]|uniref:Ubiquitin-like domain-containing protein n=1 Tax=Megalops atlanticus TaxID=7932 RepID=A0A9D3T0K5_MEGAT|nr:hypothetical protein MATL_G00247600 [Megalops atlanticus]